MQVVILEYNELSTSTGYLDMFSTNAYSLRVCTGQDQSDNSPLIHPQVINVSIGPNTDVYGPMMDDTRLHIVQESA
jgi:hypothetical protein